MNTILLLGVGWTRDASLNPHFWTRAMVGGAALLVSLVLFDRLLAALAGAGRQVRGGNGGQPASRRPTGFHAPGASRAQASANPSPA